MQATFKISASFDAYTMDPAEPQQYDLHAIVPTLEDAQALVALFPKSAALVASTIGNGDGTRSGYIGGRGRLTSDGINGGRNETGIKRYRATVRKIQALGLEIEWTGARLTNGYATREAFEAAI